MQTTRFRCSPGLTRFLLCISTQLNREEVREKARQANQVFNRFVLYTRGNNNVTEIEIHYLHIN